MIRRLIDLFRNIVVSPTYEERREEDKHTERYYLRGEADKVSARIKELKVQFPEYEFKNSILTLYPIRYDSLEGIVQINKPLK